MWKSLLPLATIFPVMVRSQLQMPLFRVPKAKNPPGKGTSVYPGSCQLALMPYFSSSSMMVSMIPRKIGPDSPASQSSEWMTAVVAGEG